MIIAIGLYYFLLHLLGPLLALMAKHFPVDIVAQFIYEVASLAERLLLRVRVLRPV